MYFHSESQEQVFKVISQSMEESEVCSVLNVLRSISYPGIDMYSCPITCAQGFVDFFLRHQLFRSCDTKYTVI